MQLASTSQPPDRQEPGWPLVVDLDGTLTPSDTLAESVVLLLRHKPWCVFVLLAWCVQGRARLKAGVARACADAGLQLDMATLPWREDVLGWLSGQRAAGRRLVLATAAHQSIAQQVALHLGLFDQVLASTDERNLKGPAKLAAVRAVLGDSFSYIGDSRADLPLWRAARSAGLVDVSDALAVKVARFTPVEMTFRDVRGGWRTLWHAMRPHQWLKNLLLFVPLLTSFSWGDPARTLAVILAFGAFSLVASGSYLLNDLRDLPLDRLHPRKRRRALASGELGLIQGALAALGLLSVGLLLAGFVAKWLLALVLGYLVLTTAYSWLLRAYVLLDVIMLAMLYTYRVLAGGLVIGVPLTPWLMAFSAFLFLSLALVKRCAELVALPDQSNGAIPGRDYRVKDLVVLWPTGVGAGLSAIVVFGLYVGAPETATHYRHVPVLWLVGVGLAYWTGRLWIKTARGEMHDDPLVFALKDRGSRIALACILLAAVVAHG